IGTTAPLQCSFDLNPNSLRARNKTPRKATASAPSNLAISASYHRLRFLAHLVLRQKRLAKRLLKIVDAVKTFPTVRVTLRKQFVFHHVKNNLAKIFTTRNSPFFQHCDGHRPELREREITNPGQQLLPGNVLTFASLLGGSLLCKVQRLANE